MMNMERRWAMFVKPRCFGLVSARARVVLAAKCSMASLILLAVVLFSAQRCQAASEKKIHINPADLQQIEAESRPPQLVTLAMRLSIRRRCDAARLAIEKACELDPKLLLDDQFVSPQSWRLLWFGHRAILRERALAADDAAGRVEIAQWLRQAGVGRQARDMLKSALAISPDLPEACALAKTWHLFGGGPFRFDLTYGSTHSLFPTSVSDEGEALEPRSGRRWMLLPFAYQMTDKPFEVSDSELVVSVDGGARCRIHGMVLLHPEGKTKSRFNGRAYGGALEMQPDKDPVWERLVIERNNDGLVGVTAHNRIPAPHKRRSRKGSSAGRGGADRVRQVDLPSGYAAFVIEVPDKVQHVEAVYREEIEATIPVTALSMLRRSLQEVQPAEIAPFVQELIALSTDSNALLATAAVVKLGLIRAEQRFDKTMKPVGQEADKQQIVAIPTMIEQALLAALSHASEQVRQHAFEVLVDTETLLGRTLLANLAEDAQPEFLLSLLDQIEQTLIAAAVGEDETGPLTGRTPQKKNDQDTFSDLDESSVSDNVFLVLSACLYTDHDSVIERALNVMLSNGSRQDALVLMEAPGNVRRLLVDRLADVNDGPFKVSLLRILIARADEEELSRVLDTCADAVLTIQGQDDPLLRPLKEPLSPDVQLKFVQMLARSDLTALIGSQTFDDILILLARSSTQHPPLQEILLKLALDQFDDQYRCPVPASLSAIKQGAGLDGTPAESFEMLLGKLAAAFESNEKVAVTAATTLLKAGRVVPLLGRLQADASGKGQAGLIERLTEDKKLLDGWALPLFLAGCLDGHDPVGSQAALQGLAQVYKNTDAQARWQLNLLVKLAVKADELVALAYAKDEKLARAAASLLRQIGDLTQMESEKLLQAASASARRNKLSKINRERAALADGRFGCLLCVDLEMADGPGRGRTKKSNEQWTDRLKPSASGVMYQPDRWLKNVPFLPGSISIKADTKDTWQVLLNDISIVGETRDQSKSRQADSPTVNVAALLATALNAANETGQEFARYVDRQPLGEQITCDLRHVQLGTRVGECRVSRPREADPSAPLQIVEVRVFAEPVQLDRPQADP